MAATTKVRFLVWTFRNTQDSLLKLTQVTQNMSTSNLGCRGHNATPTLDVFGRHSQGRQSTLLALDARPPDALKGIGAVRTSARDTQETKHLWFSGYDVSLTR